MTTAAAQARYPLTQGVNPWLVTVSVMLPTFMEVLDTAIASVALPYIAGSLSASNSEATWVLTSYLVASAIILPISGWLANRIGRKRFYMTCVALFTICSLLCGLAPTLPFLILARILQGIGGGGLAPSEQAILADTFPVEQRGQAFALYGMAVVAAPAIGPTLGGWITDNFNWHWIFFINLPVGLLGLYLVDRHLPDYRQENSPPLDLVGLILFGLGIGLLAYVLEVFGEHTLGGGTLLALLAVSAVCLVAYGMRAGRIKFPLLRLTLFGIRTFRASVSGSFFTRLGIGGIPFLFPLLYQVGLGFTPIQSGLLIMPQAAAALSLKIVLRNILQRFGYRRVLIANTVMLGVMTLSFATIGAGTPVWLIVIQVFIFGMFTSLQYSSMNTLVFADVTEEQTSGASAITSTVQQMSISFGIAIGSLLTALFVPDRFHTSAPQMIHGIHLTFLILGGWTIVSAYVFRELKKDDGNKLSLHKALQHAGT